MSISKLSMIPILANVNISDTGAKDYGVSMISDTGSKFKLETGKIYSYQGSKVQVKGDQMQVVYNSDQHSGAVHEYDGGEWNGKPIDLTNYAKLVIVLEKITGDLNNVKFEINDQEVLTFGQLKEGANTIDLSEMKKDDFKPVKAISKINFVNKPGQGKYRVRMFIQ